ncbi:MAG: hypothetical protein U1F76_18760 [Candidatus Competibacteraceae bacterium]
MNRQHSIENHYWRKTPLALAILAALQGTAIQEAFAAGAVPAGPPPNPAGPELQVNTETIGSQIASAVAMDTNGNFVVAWQSAWQDGSHYGIYAQRYSTAGVPQGPEFRVNTYTIDDQLDAAVAMDTAGDFVITWTSLEHDGDGEGVYAQRYNAAGVPQGPEFQVNTYTIDAQLDAAVAMDATGDFVVVWESDGQDGDREGIYAQRYNAVGVPQGPEFRVNTYTTSYQRSPVVAMDATGNFVVIWESDGQDGSDSGIYAQRYDTVGTPQGTEFQINTYTDKAQDQPAVAMDAAGNFVVTWRSDGQDGSDGGIYARRYDAAGVPQGTEFQVNTITAETQLTPAVDMDRNGGFVIVWTSYAQDNVYAQRYNPTGVPQGSEFQVNTYTPGEQFAPAVTMDAAGDFVVTWTSDEQDGDLYGIYAQRYAVNNYNAAFSTPVLSNQHTDRIPVTEGPAGTFSFDAQFCNINNSTFPLTGLVNQTVTLTNGNCLVNRNYGPAGTPSLNPGVLPCGGPPSPGLPGATLDFPMTGNYSDYALAVGECVTVHYQIGLQNRNRFSFFVDVGGM